MTAPELASRLGLEPLPQEGGRWAQTHLDDDGSAILYLLAAGERSHLHLLPGPEVYFFHAGAPLDLLLLHPRGPAEQVLLGPDLGAGQQLQLVIPGGVWQGSSSTGAWSLVGTAMAPPFAERDYRHGDRTELSRRWPSASARIAELTDP